MMPDLTTGIMKWIWQTGRVISARISAPEPTHDNIYDITQQQNQRKSSKTATDYTASKVLSITPQAVLDVSPGKRKLLPPKFYDNMNSKNSQT